MKKRSYRAQKVNEVRWEEVADWVKEKAVRCWQHLPSHILRVLASCLIADYGLPWRRCA